MSPVQRTGRNRKGGLVKGRPQKCVFCGKVLQNYFSLEMHMNSHTRERPWECNHCEATFMSYNVLIVHRNNIHLGKKFKCNLCHRLFNIASHLYTHRKRVHPHEKFASGRNKVKKGGPRRARRMLNSAVVRVPGQRGRPRKNETPVTIAAYVSRAEEEEEEERRKTVEIESNPGTPLMTVNILSKDADVVSKLKLPVIKIQRLPDGVWKQKIVSTGGGTCYGNPSIQSETENESGGEDVNEDDVETEPEELVEFYLDEVPPAVKDIPSNLQLPPPPPVYQSVTAPPPPTPLYPHQIPPLPPFNLAFPPFPFRLHNFTVPDNTTGDYIGSINNHHQQQHPPPQQPNCWDTSFFLHLNRYKPEDSCYHSDSRNSADNSKSPIRSTRSYQYVSKFCLKKKIGLRKQRKPLKESKRKKRAPQRKQQQQQQPSNKAITDVPNATKAEREELIEETETGVFTCKECGKEFQIKWNLLTHLMTHTGEKPFGCFFCKMRFRQKAHMIKHIASIHRFQDDKKHASTNKGKGKISEKDDFSCGFCGEVFEVKLGLIKHISHLHGEKLTESV